MTQYRYTQSEWNAENLKKVLYWQRYVPTRRQLWGLHLDVPEHKAQLQHFFRQYGSLFVKTVSKGWAGIYHSYAELLASLGDLTLLRSSSKDLLVSEVMELKTLRATLRGQERWITDEWRHHIYRGTRVCSTHAFSCDVQSSDHSTQAQHIAYTNTLIKQLAAKEFASSYVLDTCQLRDGQIEAVEVNNLFASGIYAEDAVKALARAIAVN